MSRYEKYKDSGIAWIGEIPEGWDTLKFKYSGSFEKGRLPQETNIDSLGFPIIGASEMLGKSPRMFSQDTNLPFCNKRDVLILWDGANAGITATNLQGIVSSTAVKYSCKRNLNNRYISYLFKYAEVYFKQKVNGTTIPHMSMAFINDIPLLSPSVAEQEVIAEFLDRKCGEIDELVALQETMIGELVAYKQSVITEAVTRGLNPNAPLRDSGIEWIGSIPAHWNTLFLRRVIVVLTDYTANGSFADLAKNVKYEDFGYSRLVRLTDLRENLNNEQKIFVSKYSHHYLKKSELFGSEILLANVGAYAGLACLMPEIDFPATLGPNMFLIKFSKEIDNRYVYYSLRSQYLSSQLKNRAISSAQPKLNKEDVRSCIMVRPPLQEQQAIADHLDRKCEEIDQLIAIKREKIDQLKEYKKSVIFEYVTGKKRVQ